MRVEHWPFLRARLAGRHTIGAARVGTDDDLGIVAHADIVGMDEDLAESPRQAGIGAVPRT